MIESRDGIRCIDRRAWRYNQTLRYNGRDALTRKELVGCTNLNHKQDLVPLTFSRDNILEVDPSQEINQNTGGTPMHETLDPSALPEHQIFSCPVCGGKLSRQLPTIEDILKDEFTFSEDFCIADSVMLVACYFFHDRDEDDGNFPLIIPHPLTAVIKMVFGSACECTAFEILDVCTPDSLGESLRVNDVKEVKL